MELGTDAQRTLRRVKTGSSLGVVLLKFVLCALLLLMTWSLAPLVSHAGESPGSPFDGMSAIEIKIAAAHQRHSGESTGKQEGIESAAATSGIQFLRCDLVELNDHPLHPGEFPIPGEPLPDDATARVQFNQFVHSTAFRLLSESGGLLENITLDPPENQTASSNYHGSFTVPGEAFRIAATGQDLDDQAFDVACERLYVPQTVEVHLDPKNVLVNAGNFELDGVITNHGAQATFNFSASSDIGITVTPSTTSVELGPDESAPFTLSLVIPQISSGVLDIEVTVNVVAEGNPDLKNQARATLWVERWETVFGDDFE
jgi:hypothetical protein